LHEFLGSRFNNAAVRKAAAIASIIAYIGLLATEISVGYRIVAALFPSGTEFLGVNLAGFLIVQAIVLFVIAYTSFAGFRAVIGTDKYQFAFVVIMIFAIWYVINGDYWSSFTESYHEAFKPILSFDAIFNPDDSGYGMFAVFFIVANLLFWGGWWPSAMDQ